MTAIYHPDLVAWSNKRLFRFEASSPHNLPEWHPDRETPPYDEIWPGAFQRRFRYALHRGDSDASLWTVDQAEREDSPRALFVSDEGWCVARTDGDGGGLIVIDPAGRRAGSIDVLRTVFAGDVDREVTYTTAGFHWGGDALTYFVDLGGSAHFCMRTWRGRRVLIDLERGRWVDGALDAAVTAALFSEESARVIATLEAAVPIAAEWDVETREEYERLADVRAAITHAGRLGLSAAADLVRAFEGLPAIDGRTTGFPDLPSSGPLSGWWLERFVLRPVAALALRRLGHTPRGFATCRFVEERWSEDEDGDEVESRALEAPEHVADRDRKVRALSPGTTLLEAIARVGAPDDTDSHTWDFDEGGASGCTLRAHWSKAGTLVRVEELRPPVWAISDLREQSLHPF